MHAGSGPDSTVRIRRPVGFRAVLCAGALALLAAPAAAQEAVTLDQYRPAPLGDDGFAISRPGDLGHLRGGLRLDFDYAMNPLVYEEDVGDSSTEVGAIVKDHLVLQLIGTLGLLDRLVLWVGLPVNLFMSGRRFEGMPEPDGSRPGDLYLGIRGRIWGEPDELFGFGAQAAVSAPLACASDDDVWLSGEQSFAGTATLLAELRWRYVVATLNVGARFRQPSDVTTTEVGQELLWGLGLTFPILPGTLAAYLETYGATTFVVFGKREATPVELLAGVRVWEDHGLSVSAAVAAGVVRGYGAPDVRGVVSLSWTLPEEGLPDEEPAPPVESRPFDEPAEPSPEPSPAV
ncbi:MAG: hypothetical protein JXB32_15955 [Deltaproteobacteria bacterium]|nr:hypothetical protein [Deltaproteobacteria bacterium]